MLFFLDIPDNNFARSWNLSMEQCRKSRHSGYLFGEVILNNPRILCLQIPSDILVVWVGVRRQKYKYVDRGKYEYFLLVIVLDMEYNTFMQMIFLPTLTHFILVYNNIIIHPLKFFF